MCMHNVVQSVSQSMLLTYYEYLQSSDIDHSTDASCLTRLINMLF